ncbi:MAG: RNA polymerase subunit sigma-24 [Actinobacteria bacterium]|nr:MAG: RNA polymerase subunit sigma-24 [Actinomycetota bacterium]
MPLRKPLEQPREHPDRFPHLSFCKEAIVKPNERILVWRLRRGDAEACRELIRRYHSRVYGYLRRLGADPGQAEDLTQETYTRAWQAIRNLRKAASLRSWLLTIARNQFFQQARVGRPEITALDELPDRKDDAPAAEIRLVRDERDRNVRRAVSRLEPALRETIALHYFQGLSFRETGVVMGIPAGTVKSRVHRALGRLQQLLEPQEAENEPERTAKTSAGHS